jgi:hypothetical protein
MKFWYKKDTFSSFFNSKSEVTKLLNPETVRIRMHKPERKNVYRYMVGGVVYVLSDIQDELILKVETKAQVSQVVVCCEQKTISFHYVHSTVLFIFFTISSPR